VSQLLRWFMLLISCGGLTSAFAVAEPQEQLLLDLPTGELLFVAADIYSPAATKVESTISSARKEQAQDCFRRARLACEQNDVGTALRLATQAVYLDPDYEDARRVLGYQRIGDNWAGSYAARRLNKGEIWHSQFGWILGEDVARYEAGERRLGKQWISTEDDARRHATIDRGWQIRTDHFRVITNYRRKDANELAVRLETLYQLWQQLFGEFYLDGPTLLRRFDGKPISGYRSQPFHVVYYGSREEYNATLRRQQPRIGITLGIYFDKTRKSHFFAGPDQDPGTIYHEAVHQLFYESARASHHLGALSNAWILEGVACYFESLQEHQDPATGRFFTLGTAGAGRLPAARHRRLVNDYYVPLAELSALGMSDLQRRTDIARLYSQSAGLVTFLIHGQGGKYRSALVKLLRLIYTGRDKSISLQQLAGCDFAVLDRQYREFLAELPPPPVEEQAK
jgi:hypothetical protein